MHAGEHQSKLEKAMSGEIKNLVNDKDRNVSAIKAALKLLPAGVGEAMIQFYWGKGEEARQRRLDETLDKIAAKMEAEGVSSKIGDNEDFGNFFSQAGVLIANATNEDKRKRFQDLLYNSMLLPPGDAGWEDSMHCLELLQKIDHVSLYCLAKIAKAESDELSIGITGYSGIARWVTLPRCKLDQIPVSVAADGYFEDLQYSDVLVTKSLKKIKDELLLVISRNLMVLADGFATGMDFYSLSPEAKLLVKWTIAEF